MSTATHHLSNKFCHLTINDDGCGLYMAVNNLDHQKKKHIEQRIIILHGQGSSMHDMLPATISMVQSLHNTEFIVINGFYTVREVCSYLSAAIPEDFNPDTSYTWFHPDPTKKKEGINKLAARIRQWNTRRQDVPTSIFGFSEGGFLAAEMALHNPQDISKVFLHSSAMIEPVKIQDPDVKTAFESTSKPKIKTLISIHDPYFILGLVALKPVLQHYRNQVILRKAGYDVKTQISYGFRHNTNRKSLKIAAQFLGKAL